MAQIKDINSQNTGKEYFYEVHRQYSYDKSEGFLGRFNTEAEANLEALRLALDGSRVAVFEVLVEKTRLYGYDSKEAAMLAVTPPRPAPKMLVDEEWLRRKAAAEGDHEVEAGTSHPEALEIPNKVEDGLKKAVVDLDDEIPF